MAYKKGSLSYYAAQLRQQGKRRIARLEKAANDESASSRVRNWSRDQIANIEDSMKATMRVKGWQKNKAESDKQVGAAMRMLARDIFSVAPKFTTEGDTFEITQQQLNLASAKRPSMYTKKETQVFYRATQKIWQKTGITESDENRNEAIMEYFNKTRRANGLRDVSLDEIVEYILKSNKAGLLAQDLDPRKVMSPGEEDALENAQKSDDEDTKEGSPPGIGQAIINEIRDAFAGLFTLPDPTALRFEQIQEYFEE